MTTVRETMVQLERQCLGLGVPYAEDPCWGCEEHRIQYEIVGPGGGVWHVALRQDGGELLEEPARDPLEIVHASVEDWLALWAGRAPLEHLVQSGRVTFSRREDDASDEHASAEPASFMESASELNRLGVLGPLPESGYWKYHGNGHECEICWEYTYQGCAEPETCSCPRHWTWVPPRLANATGLSWFLASMIAVSFCIAIGRWGGLAVGLGSGPLLFLAGWIASEVALGAGMRRSPRFFRFLAGRRLIEGPRPDSW
jgi:hypothetical protein